MLIQFRHIQIKLIKYEHSDCKANHTINRYDHNTKYRNTGTPQSNRE